MKEVICIKQSVNNVTDEAGNRLPAKQVKAPEHGKPYRVTGEYRANGNLYYFLMGLGIKQVYRADLFQDA